MNRYLFILCGLICCFSCSNEEKTDIDFSVHVRQTVLNTEMIPHFKAIQANPSIPLDSLFALIDVSHSGAFNQPISPVIGFCSGFDTSQINTWLNDHFKTLEISGAYQFHWRYFLTEEDEMGPYSIFGLIATKELYGDDHAIFDENAVLIRHMFPEKSMLIGAKYLSNEENATGNLSLVVKDTILDHIRDFNTDGVILSCKLNGMNIGFDDYLVQEVVDSNELSIFLDDIPFQDIILLSDHIALETDQ